MWLLSLSIAVGFVHTTEHMSETTEDKGDSLRGAGEEAEVLQVEGIA